jgi:hypothetical protein
MHPSKPPSPSSRRWIITVALTGVAAATTTAALADTSSKMPSVPSRASAAAGVDIGSTTLGTDLKVTLRAYKSGDYDAKVDVAAFRYENGAWRPVWREPVPGTWFYYPLTSKGGVCSLKVGNAPQAAPTVDVSLLITPSIGCSDPQHFTVK